PMVPPAAAVRRLTESLPLPVRMLRLPPSEPVPAPRLSVTPMVALALPPLMYRLPLTKYEPFVAPLSLTWNEPLACWLTVNADLPPTIFGLLIVRLLPSKRMVAGTQRSSRTSSDRRGRLVFD